MRYRSRMGLGAVEGSLVLATDLDGTFLGGSQAERRDLYELVHSRRSELTLLFVTGRDLDFVRSLPAEGVPEPDAVIADVGTTVCRGLDGEPVREVEEWIADRWPTAVDDPNLQQVEALLDSTPGIRPQQSVGGRRRSYYYEPATLPADLPVRVAELGFDCITSADTFLDVMPRGVHKGSTLLRTLGAFGLAADHTVVCGDTLNDLAMLTTGLKGVAVGNSEPRLVEALRHVDKVYMASAAGCAGIREGLEHHGYLL